ncbi:class I SAM-dependent methyltransferase [Pseudomonadota bacterium]
MDKKNKNKLDLALKRLRDLRWPESDLEYQDSCPVCKDVSREILNDDLVDNVFEVARGKWVLWQCSSCKSAYLDPRPTEQSIGRAYGSYYTHKSPENRKISGRLSVFRQVRRAISNSYLNSRYGTSYQPHHTLGTVLAYVIPSQREVLDVQFRWLPKPKPGQNLLDVGCGNGTFLLKARDSGWTVEGVDFDGEAVEAARVAGLNVNKGSLELFEGSECMFDVITLNHVIEHVHHPLGMLMRAYSLLKPGGTLYLETPNIQSRGAKLFGCNWRGLEAPRHLVLFTVNSMQLLLKKAGFVGIVFKRRRKVTKHLFLASQKMVAGLSPYDSEPIGLTVDKLVWVYMPLQPLASLEFITLHARKPL